MSYPSDLHLRRSLGKLGDGLDVMAEGSYVVAPPSLYVNGKTSAYTLVVEADPAPAPHWLVEHASAPPPSPVSRERGDGKDYPSATLGTLEAAREALRRHGPAVEGQAGDNHTYRAAAILANDFALSPEEAWPLFLEWNATCKPPWAEDDLARKLRGGEKYARGERGEARDVVIVESALRSAALARPGPASARASATPDGRYSVEDVARFAERQGCAPAEWRKRWVIQCGSSFWIWVNGRYATPVPSTQALGTAEQYLAPAGLEFQKPMKKGDGYKKKTLAEVMEDYGSFAFKVEAYLDLQESYYDPVAGVLHEAVCPVRDDLRPEFSPQIDRWLRLLGGPLQEALLDWVATVTVLGKPSCALYFCSETGIGKQLFADGLARIWSLGGPSSLKNVLGQFNETLVRCPLVLADEKLPKLYGQSGISGELRTIIAESSRTLNRKNIAHANLGGCIRLVIAANNEHALEDKSERDLTQADVEAIASRYLFIDTRPRTAEIRALLDEVGWRAGTEAWVAGDAIARHALWLRDNRAVVPGKRFLVEGRLTQMHEAVAWAYGITGDLLLWICRYVENPMKVQQQAGAGVLCGNGVVLATASTMTEFWCHYLKREQPSETLVGRQLRNVSRKKRRVVVFGRYRNYYEINLDMLLSFAEREVDADVEELKRRINTVDPNWSRE